MDFFNLTFPLFRVFGIALRMHWFMAIMIAVNLAQGAARDGAWGLQWMAVTMTILLLSILIHELCHCWAAISLGGRAEKILFWPLGGLAYVEYPTNPRNNILVSGAGPASTFAIAAACLGALLLTGAPWSWEILNPFFAWWPPGLSTAQVFLLHAVRLNLILGLLNLVVPAYPLDGGVILMSFLTIRYGRQRAATATAMIAIPIGIALAVLGFAMGDFFLGLIGVWVLFEAWQLRRLAQRGELDAHPAFAREAEYDYMPDRPKRPGFFARWRARRAQQRARRDAARADALRARVDEILDKVNREGIGSLTAAERRILEEASRQRRD